MNEELPVPQEIKILITRIESKAKKGRRYERQEPRMPC